MNTNGYTEVKVSADDDEITTSGSDRKPFLRQLLISSGVWTSYFVMGLCIGAPTVFIPQIRRENSSTEVISDDMASWLTSVMNFSGFPCVIVLSILTKFVGRRTCFILAVGVVLVAFIVFYCSNTVLQILIAEIMQGFFSAAQIGITVVIITEYTSPKYRGLFLAIKTSTVNSGIWVSNAVGTFFHWKNIGLIGIVCVLYTMATVLIWPESPYWLASKGRYKECAASHRWLKGCDEESEKELKYLIHTQKEYIKSCKNVKLTRIETVKDLFSTVVSREFYKPTLISILTGMLSILSGKLVCTMYAIDIIKQITENESTAYTGMLILDGITVFSMYVGSFLSRFLNRRTLLLVSSSVGVVFLLFLSLYLYLIRIAVIKENKYVSISLLMLFSIAISCGPLILSVTVYGELIPIRSRNLAVCVIAVVGKLSIGISLKTAPYLIKAFGLHGIFLYFGITSACVIGVLYKYLPETKDKTLQEISDSMNGKKNNNVKVAEVDHQLMK